MTTAGVSIDTRELARLRRDVAKTKPAVGKVLTRELRVIAVEIAHRAGELTPKKTGALAADWHPSITYGKGVAIRNRKVYAGQHEYGKQIWLRRGHPYIAKPGPLKVTSAPGRNGAALPVRQVRLTGSLVVNEGHYLIKRTAPGKTAVLETLPLALVRIDRAVTKAVDQLV